MEKRAKRLLQKKRHIERQIRILKKTGIWGETIAIDAPHRLHKVHALNCGKPKCLMCMNPRKSFGEKTIQERKFEAVGIDE
jgi:hypothetical protein